MTGPVVRRLRAVHPVETTDDATVIEKSWSDPAVFGVLFDTHAPLIYRYIARRVGRQGSDDLVAETFVAAFGGRHRYDLARRDARPWLYGIATNVISRHRRDELKQLRIHQGVSAQSLPTDHADRVVLDLTARSLRGELVTALADLAESDRDVLILIAWEDLTYEEVASALAIPIGTVRSRLHRARAQLRPLLDHLITSTTIKEVLTND
jgi:RNA polymerase sigma factor (sigma-70 family)